MNDNLLSDLNLSLRKGLLPGILTASASIKKIPSAFILNK